MSILANALMALRGINSNKLRSLLTMLGVLIGVAAVIVLLAVGTGSSQAVANSINQLGTNTLTVFSSGRFGGGTSQTGTQTRNAVLTQTDVKLISDPNNAPDVQSVSPVITTSETATYQGASATTSVIGSTPSYLPASNYTVQSGRSISSADVKAHAGVSGCQSGGGWSTVNCVEPWFQVDGAVIVRTGMPCVRTCSRRSEAPEFSSVANPDGITISPIWNRSSRSGSAL